MVDENGQPVGRTNYGINGEETYRFMGKSVETVEDECIVSYDDAETGDVIAVFMRPTDYAINSNLQMTAVKWVDHDTNEVKSKCILICDGKLVDSKGVLIIKKGVASV
jgi:HK97 family phage major capsid protein